MSQPLQPRTARRRSRRFGGLLVVTVLFLTAGMALQMTQSAAEGARTIPAPIMDEPADASATSEIAILAGGCFWGVQGVFQHVEGVTRAVSGYAGGDSGTAHYEMVGSNTTGHAESVQVTFDPRRISYGHILQIYFSVAHDPTELNRQGQMPGLSIARQSFRGAPNRRASPRHISSSSTKRIGSMRRS